MRTARWLLAGLAGLGAGIASAHPHMHFSFSLSRPASSYSISVWSAYGIGPPAMSATLGQGTLAFYPPLLPGLGEEGIPLSPPPRLPPLPPLLGEEAGAFRPVRPEDRVRAQQPAPPPPPAEKPAPKPRQPPREPPLPPPPELDPEAEHARQMTLGRQAFVAREYGRAEQRFRDAIAVLPDDPEAHFLLAQVRFALGKYQEAIEAIAAGLRLRPDWPAAAFRPLELYEDNVADYAEHMRQLAEALARRPNDPVLLFLSAYELWFDGRREEAVPLFERAAALGAFQPLIERFLRHARAGGPFI